jgi:hypothetical protein
MISLDAFVPNFSKTRTWLDLSDPDRSVDQFLQQRHGETMKSVFLFDRQTAGRKSQSLLRVGLQDEQAGFPHRSAVDGSACVTFTAGYGA